MTQPSALRCFGMKGKEKRKVFLITWLANKHGLFKMGAKSANNYNMPDVRVNRRLISLVSPVFHIAESVRLPFNSKH